MTSDADHQQNLNPSNTEREYQVTEADLPVYCPGEGSTLWDSHPRVYLSFEGTDEARCPYCGALYRLNRD